MKSKEVAFTKGQIIGSDKFLRIDRDILRAILEDGKEYTLKECHSILEKFKKKEVK